ncbi:MAG: hypothetical protein MUO27_02285 [Sedimentisphaerales bacterium]|nr:hypothetical protein [Sedimentisphaerales bacterium]
MKRRNLVLMVFSVVFMLPLQGLYAFDNKKTHPALTDKAAAASTIDDYLKTQIRLNEGINTRLSYNFPSEIQERIMRAQWLPEKTQRTMLEWLKVGSAIEDEDGDKHPIRARHHFYDPNRNAGLNNKDDNPNWHGWPNSPFKSFDLTGESALTWTVDGTASQNPTTNNQSWQSSRTDFYHSLTKPLKNDREKYLAMTFLDLGCVLHIVEDMGVPAHARNDFLFAHYRKSEDYGEPFEGWVEKMVRSSGSLDRWISPEWTPTPKIFAKVSDYFDTNTRNTDNYLGDSVLPPDSWGLSESTNYQFLSWTTIFRDANSLYYFPHPARIHTTEVNESGRVYLAGYGISHLARQTMSYDHLRHDHLDKAWCTLGKDIYDDYARVSLPRTIDYATGLVNYFFRGKLEVEPNCLDCNTVTFIIRNISDNSGVEQTLKGGTFELYWDDGDGNRTQVDDFIVAGWTASSILDYDEQVTGTFAKPDSSGIEKYTVVYKGSISENPDEPDYDDANAIAVGTLIVGYPIIAWGDDGDGIVSNIPEGNDFVDVAAGKYHALAIRSSGSLVAWGWNNYGQCDVPEGNDFVAIAGGVRHSIALKSDGTIVGWGDNGSGQIDVPEGNNFVTIASGDYHNLAITTEGLIVGWGQNYYGECDAPEPNEGTVYVAVSAGRYHSLALQSDGRIKAWGSNTMGQTRIYQFADDDHEAIAAADTYNFLLLTDDMLVTWGGGDWAEPGIPDYHYRPPDGHDFVAIAAGGYHILALTAEGEILSWGWNDYDPPLDPVPEGVVFTKDVAAGWKFSVALKSR